MTVKGDGGSAVRCSTDRGTQMRIATTVPTAAAQLAASSGGIRQPARAKHPSCWTAVHYIGQPSCRGRASNWQHRSLSAATPTSDLLERITMQPRFVPISFALMAALGAPPVLPAQEIVEVTGRDRPIDAAFEEVYRVGVLDGESWEMFAEVSEVAFDADGNLYVFDGTSGLLGSGSLRVLVFDADGGFLREFGSSGGGPGEFNRPNGFAVLHDGTVVVSDIGHRAFQLLDASGGLIRMVRVGDDLAGMSVLGEILPDPRGAGVFAGAFGGPGVTIRGAGAGPVTPPTSRPVMRVGLGGETMQADTMVHGWLPTRSEITDLAPNNVPAQVREMLRNMSMPTVFEPEMLVGVFPDGGIVHSDSSTYTLKITPPGATEVARIIRRPFRPEPVTPEVEREYAERRAAARRDAGMGQVSGSRMMVVREGGSGANPNPGPPTQSSFQIEERYYHEVPVLRGLATSWNGRIWVQRRGEYPESDGPIDVVTSDGEYVGTYSTDATAMPDAFGPDGLAAYIELDDFDVASVVVRRLPTEVR